MTKNVDNEERDFGGRGLYGIRSVNERGEGRGHTSSVYPPR